MQRSRLYLGFALVLAGTATGATDLWELARQKQQIHRFSTLMRAQDVRDLLSTPEGLAAAVDWCKGTAVTKAYVESFRSGYQVERPVLERARDTLRAAGIEVSGGVTTTGISKPPSCYATQESQDRLQAIFEYAASLFDEIMIDDFWTSYCTCTACDTARKARTVTVGNKTYPVPSDSWEDYRRVLMVELSRQRLLGAAKRVNPKARLIIKYPQWYDRFQDRGYDVELETKIFDRIWVGTETRDRQPRSRLVGVPQYEAYFIMRWLGGIGGPRTGGGWYDPYFTSPKTYIEQARQTVLAGARESTLFCYGSLLGTAKPAVGANMKGAQMGPADVEALRPKIPELFEVAKQVSRRRAVGIAAYKPPNSRPEKEGFVFDYVGMLGLPLAPCHEFPTDAKAAFFSIHALKDPDFVPKLERLIRAGKPVLLTDGLAQRLEGKAKLNTSNVQILRVNADPAALLKLPEAELDRIRAALLRPLKTSFRAPTDIGLYLFDDGSWVVCNFRDEDSEVEVKGEKLRVPVRDWVCRWK